MYPIPYIIRHPYSIPYSTSVLKLENRSRITLFENGDCDREIVDFFWEKFSKFFSIAVENILAQFLEQFDQSKSEIMEQSLIDCMFSVRWSIADDRPFHMQ
jgi:hypothetical protein